MNQIITIFENMNAFKIYFRSLCFLLIVFLLTSDLFGQRVLVIGIDGCREDVAVQANTPTLDYLKANGLSSADALNNDITISGPGWSAILCGVWSDKHGVVGNDFNGDNYAQYPSFFKRIEDYNSDLNTVSICHWSPINTEIVGADADLAISVGSDQEVADQAILQLNNRDPHVMFLHFDEADGVGHSQGFAASIPNYVSIIETIDNLLGSVIAALEARPNYESENWAILVTSDHGGIGFSHGGNTFEEQNIPFIISGNSVPLEVVEKDSFLVAGPVNFLGDTVALSFDGQGDFVQINNDPLYDFGSTQDFTVECRVRTESAGDFAIIGNKDWDSGGNPGFVFSFKFPSGPEWKVNIGDGTNRADLNNGGLIADGQWHTLSVSFDRDGMMRMYEDGVFLDQTDISQIGNINTAQGLFFGSDINQDYSYTGLISEVRVWNTLLSDQNIQDYYCQSVDNSHPEYASLIGHWKMDDPSVASSTADSSPSGNHGIIQSATWVETDSLWSYKAPTIADIAVSALGHMCIPISLDWNLDGQSWVRDCIYDDRDCVNAVYNTWIGPASGHWNKNEHWSRCFIPKSCDHIVIPNGNEVIVPAFFNGHCRTLNVGEDAKLVLLDDAQVLVKEPN